MNEYWTFERPNTSTWGDPGLDAYTDGHQSGEQARVNEEPGPDRRPRNAWEWGFHDGWHDVDTADREENAEEATPG